MDGCDRSWLRSVMGAVRRFQAVQHATLDELGAEVSHLAWAERAPSANTLAGAKDRFRRHPIAGVNDLGCSALLMYWPPGHATLPHDHGGFWGIEVVLDGTLQVEEFIRGGSLDAPSLTKSSAVSLGIGDAAVFTSPRYVHRCRNLSNAAPTLTLHVYGGMLERYVAFDKDASGVLRAAPRIALSDAPLA
jgi:hypothetical protein